MIAFWLAECECPLYKYPKLRSKLWKGELWNVCNKAAWNKRAYVKADTFYASNQLCSACGYQNRDTKALTVRK